MYRVVRILGFFVLCFLLASGSVLLVIFWDLIAEHAAPPRRVPPQPPIVVSPPTAAEPALAVVLPEPPPRKGDNSWSEVEKEFDEIRARRDERPGWKDNPAAVYEVVANPAFTDSSDILDHCVALSQWRREIPDSPTPLIALARAHIDWAWQARGYGPASTVTKEGWQLFYTRIAEARRLLEEAKRIGVKDGEAYRLLIMVGLAEGDPYEEVRATLEEGRKLDPTYFPMYTQFARYLLPRWQGKRGDVERFAIEVVDLLPGNDGLEAYARIAMNIHQTDSERELIFFGEYDKKLLVKASQVLMERRERKKAETNFAALCAWAAQDREAALPLRKQVQETVEDNSIWPSEQIRREFLFWCDRDAFAAAEDAPWFWGSMFNGDNLAFWKDSRSIWCANGYGDDALNLMDIEGGRIRLMLPALAPKVECFTTDANKNWVAAGLTGGFFERGFKGIRVWRLNDPEHPRSFKTPEQCTKIAIHPSLPRIAWAQIGFVFSLDVTTGKQTSLFNAKGQIRNLLFSPDGKWLIVSTERESIWDSETGELVHEMPHSGQRPQPDHHCRRIFDIDSEGRIWALVSRHKMRRYPTSLVRYAPDAKNMETLIEDLVTDLVMPGTAILSADHRLLALNTIRPNQTMPRIEIDVWDVESGKKIKHFAGHLSQFSAMSFSPDGKWLASMGFPTGLVRMWSLEGAEE
jgi:hypothetical protein